MFRGLTDKPWFAWALAAIFVAVMFALPAALFQPHHNEDYYAPYQQSDQVVAPVSADERLADYTQALAIWTAVLALVAAIELYYLFRQERWMRESVEVTRIAAFAAQVSADAAKQSADVLPALERAYLFIQQDGSTDLVGAARGFKIPPIALQHINNFGRTPAIIKSARRTIAVRATAEEARDAAVNEIGEWIIAANTTSEPEEGDYSRSFHARYSESAEFLFADEREGLKSEALFMWLYCRLEYADVFGREHVTASLHRVNVSEQALEKYGGDEWNYRT